MSIKEIQLPDIGGFDSVEIIELHIAVGDKINAEDPIVTLESEKATMDIPSPQAGTVSEISVSVGDKIAQGSVLCSINIDEASAVDTNTRVHQAEITNNDNQEDAVSTPTADNTAVASKTKTEIKTELLVLGAGPGGYTAAFRAAD
ncbi:MAG: dihydrolipoamide dehydrogenase, partial [Chitinophagales bacterium]